MITNKNPLDNLNLLICALVACMDKIVKICLSIMALLFKVRLHLSSPNEQTKSFNWKGHGR